MTAQRQSNSNGSSGTKNELLFVSCLVASHGLEFCYEYLKSTSNEGGRTQAGAHRRKCTKTGSGSGIRMGITNEGRDGIYRREDEMKQQVRPIKQHTTNSQPNPDYLPSPPVLRSTSWRHGCVLYIYIFCMLFVIDMDTNKKGPKVRARVSYDMGIWDRVWNKSAFIDRIVLFYLLQY